MNWANNRVAHVNLGHQNIKANVRCAIHLDVMAKQATHQREFLERVPYNCTACAWAGRYPHLHNILADEPWMPKYWVVVNNTFCDIEFDGVRGRPLIDGDFDRATFGVSANNTNSSKCVRLGWREKKD